MSVPAPPCLSTTLLLHPLATRGPRSHSPRALVARLPEPRLLCSSLPLQVVQLVSHSRATARPTTCPQATMLLEPRRPPVGLQWRTLADLAATYRPTRWRCQETALAEHPARRRQSRRLFHHPAATTALLGPGTATQTTTAAASPPSTHQETPAAASTATARPALAICP